MHWVLDYVMFVLHMNFIFIMAALKWILPKNRKSIDGEVCLITGAARGIGRMLALEFAKKGAELVLWDINSTGLDETASLVREVGGKVFTDVVDISKRENVYAAAEKVFATVGDVGILINNAGIVYSKDFFDLKDEEIIKTFSVNSLAPFWTCRAFLPRMMEKNRGHVVNVASTLGFLCAPGVTDYVSSKHAVVGFHNSLTFDLIKRKRLGVKTTLVCPHLVKTEMFDEIAPQRYPPPLDADYCVNTIMDAILTNKPQLTMPRFMYFVHWLTTLLPHEAMVLSQHHYGTFDLMDDVGEVKKKNF